MVHLYSGQLSERIWLSATQKGLFQNMLLKMQNKVQKGQESIFEHVRDLCDIAATNRIEIAASLHLRFSSRIPEGEWQRGQQVIFPLVLFVHILTHF